MAPFLEKYYYRQHTCLHKSGLAGSEDGKKGPDEPPYYVENFVTPGQPGLMCHSSSLVMAGEQRILCTWYAGSREGAGDVAIYGAFYQEDPGNWSEPRVLLDRRQCAAELRRHVRKLGNPALVQDNRHRLWLFYSSTAFGGWSAASVNFKVSRDDGQTWSPSQKLILSPFFNLSTNVRHTGVNLQDGSFLLPVYHECIKHYSQLLLFCPEATEPRYEIRRMGQASRAIQPILIPEGGENLMAFFRNKARQQEKYILMAQSRDLGATWSAPINTSLPNPDSGFAMVRMDDGAYLGVINDSFSNRDNLVLVRSHDAGKTWKILKVLEQGKKKEYSYPAITRSPRYYHVTYTYERKRIKHLAFNEAWVRGLKDHGN
jgi:predicted neuraminidase